MLNNKYLWNLLLITIKLIYVQKSEAVGNHKFCTKIEKYTGTEQELIQLCDELNAPEKCTFRVKIMNFTRTKSVTSCCDGYIAVNDDCHPVCSTVCENATCSAPNHCTCRPGFVRKTAITCIHPCKDGYKFDKDFNCALDFESPHNLREATCVECQYPNVCIKQNECKCHEDFTAIEKTIGNQKIISCAITCNPPCDANGVCNSQGYCQCHDGYLLKLKNVCEKACSKECVFSECKNGECVCEPDFKLANNSLHVCEPICTVPCENGNCNGNSCLCEDGYEFINGTGCIPVCEETIVNGFCIAPNISECNDGYQSNYESNHICEPICHASDTIEDFFDDYDLDLNRSAQGCINGVCVAPQKCECFKGFRLSTRNKFLCDPDVKSAESTNRISIIKYLLILLIIAGILFGVPTTVFLLHYHKNTSYDIESIENAISVVYKPDS